jgi:hypothetical protein
MSLLRGRRYNRIKPKPGGTGANQHEQSGQNVQSARIALAAEHGVCEPHSASVRPVRVGAGAGAISR